LNMTQLLAVESRAQSRGLTLRPLVEGLSRHFRDRGDRRGRRGRPASAMPELLARLDDALHEASARGEREAVAALVGIRRDLFPAAASYQPRPQTHGYTNEHSSEAAR
jgi:hypothetical protein